MAALKKGSKTPVVAQRTSAPADSELTPLEKARLARKEKGSRLPAKELSVTNRIAALREKEGELSPNERNELKGLITEKKAMAFSRLGSKYLKVACEAIDRIAGLSSSSYVSEPSQVATIEAKITDRLATCIASFNKVVRDEAEDFSI